MERRIIVVNGKSGFGKTYLTRTLLAGELRAIIADQRGEYEGDKFFDFDALADHVANRGVFRAVWCGGFDFADSLFHLAFAIRNLVVVCEEADLLDCERGTWYREAIYRGRLPAQISIWALAQRPHLLAPDIRSQLTDVYTFNTSEPSALQWLKSCFPPEVVDSLPNLPPKRGWRFSLTASGPEIREFVLP